MRRGTTAATALAATPVPGAAGCGSDEESGAGKSPGELPGTVTWWGTATAGSEDKVFEQFAEDLEKTHPGAGVKGAGVKGAGVKGAGVKYVNVPFGDAHTAASVRIAVSAAFVFRFARRHPVTGIRAGAVEG
jgi:arabinogalactan oligomer/maltooligosaccharide transport system substrate-binding protein